MAGMCIYKPLNGSLPNNDAMNLVSWIVSQQTGMAMDIKTEYLRQQLHEQTALMPNWVNIKPIKYCCESLSRTNCCNCGAALKNFRCEYCGTINS